MVYRCSATSIIIPTTFFLELGRKPNSTQMLNRKNKPKGITIPHSKAHDRVTVAKTAWTWRGNRPVELNADLKNKLQPGNLKVLGLAVPYRKRKSSEMSPWALPGTFCNMLLRTSSLRHGRNMDMVGGPTSEADKWLLLHSGWMDTPCPSPHDLSFPQLQDLSVMKEMDAEAKSLGPVIKHSILNS